MRPSKFIVSGGRTAFLIGVAAAAFSLEVAAAQNVDTPPSADPSSADAGDMVEAVVVTGSREANATISGLQVDPLKLPQNVRVLDEQLIQDLGATRIADVFALAGITQVNTNGGTWDNYSIRGFSGDVNTGPDLLINRFNAKQAIRRRRCSERPGGGPASWARGP
jgi:iron complex outermembrane receptor protein